MFIDSHAHIDGPEFDADRDHVLQRAQAAGVELILNVGTGDPADGAFTRAISLGAKYKNVLTALGIHPHDAKLYNDELESSLKEMVRSPGVVAWGEIGLDFHYDNSPRDVQMTVFARQLRAARELGLPVIIHTRAAEAETISILESEFEGAQRCGVFHCFSGSLDLALRALELGFMISFSGILTFKKAQDLRDVARRVPLSRILIETDCPFLAPVPYRGKRNEPAFVVEVAKCLADLHGKEVTEVAGVSSENFRRLFVTNRQ